MRSNLLDVGYKDAVTGNNTAGTRAYELKGLANKVVAGGGSNPLRQIGTTAVAQELAKVGTVIAAGDSVQSTDTGITPQLFAAGGIGGTNLNGVNPLETVNPLLTNTQQVNVGLPG